MSALSLTACTVKRDANPYYGCDACPPDSCYMGFCILGGETEQTPVVGEPAPGEPCIDDGEQVDCYEGEAGTRGVGVCSDGTMTCTDGVWTACDEQLLPTAAEACDAEDDDCDGAIDEAIELGSCMPVAPGACATGKDMCVQGEVKCLPITDPRDELCNGADDDCDGKIDEDVAVEPCYSNALGCVEDMPGHFACAGTCTEGTRRCVDGRRSMVCDDQVTPVEERCEGTGAAGDENCDGRTNEGCGCLQEDEQRCYGGPSGTEGIGACRAGRQVCVRGAFGDCDGDVTPIDETCANEGEDNNCNGTRDDVPLRDTDCMNTAARGECRNGRLRCSGSGAALTCVSTTEPSTETCNARDDDCDGRIDETFDLETDEANCGRCGVECARTTQECCSSACAPVGCGMGGTGGRGGTGGAAGEGAAGQGGTAAAGGAP